MNCTKCASPASSMLSFDYATAQAWLDDLVGKPGGYHLCERHADRFAPPVGWSVSDRRSVLVLPVRDVA